MIVSNYGHRYYGGVEVREVREVVWRVAGDREVDRLRVYRMIVMVRESNGVLGIVKVRCVLVV